MSKVFYYYYYIVDKNHYLEEAYLLGVLQPNHLNQYEVLQLIAEWRVRTTPALNKKNKFNCV